NSASIPIDLILEILSRLPSKSVRRFHCVSKLWQSMLSCPYFKELYLTRSSARPRLLFVVHSVGEEKEEELHFYSSSQPRIPYDKSSLVVAADYHTTFPSERCNYASGVPKLGWRSDICCPKYYGYLSEGICISGVIYYLVCPRYEEFKVIEAQCFYNHHQTLRLINYKGKLGGISGNLNDSGAIELRMWVLHDAEKQEWSEYVYTLPENDDIKLHDFTVAGMTTRGEFVLSMIDTFKPFYVFYFNPEKNVLRSVEIQVPNKTIMNRAENPASIPIDLILEILSRLPSKSVRRFHCVSKLWRSMLSSPYFKDLYLTRSSARPLGEELHFYSSPQPQIPYDKSSLVEAADYHTTFPSRRCNYASGLICFSGKCHSRKDAMTLICNPITGKYAELPKVIMYNTSKAFLGFDPVDRQFKILVEHLPYPSARDRRHIILTSGVPKLGWRSNIVIIGLKEYASVEIYITYEEFKVIEAKCFNRKTPTLINYKGKLGGINWESGDSGAIELRMWVLHDVNKKEWSKYVYPFPENDVIKVHEFTVAGMTTRGEFVLSMLDTFKRTLSGVLTSDTVGYSAF
ncbi:hypothetical protein HID58_058673, partial [Brassica napus]